MAERYITSPFIVKLRENLDFELFPNFNGKYFVALKLMLNKYLYLTLDAYERIGNNDIIKITDNNEYKYGVDYIFSESLKIEIESKMTYSKFIRDILNGLSSQNYKLYVKKNNIIVSCTNDVTSTELLEIFNNIIKYLAKYDEELDLTQITENIIVDTNVFCIPDKSSLEFISNKIKYFENNYDKLFNATIKSHLIGADVHETYRIIFTYSSDGLYELGASESEQIVFDSLPDLILKGNVLNNAYFDEDEIFKQNKVAFSFYKSLNEILKNEDFTDEDIAVFCATFCKLILLLSLIEDVQDGLSLQDLIYKMALLFFANEGTDDALNAFSMLSNYYTVLLSNCNSGNSCSNIGGMQVTSSTYQCNCALQYREYMVNTLNSMLGNTDFYKNWFIKTDNEQNDELCDILIKLIDAFIALGYDLSFSKHPQFDCPSITSLQSKCNYLTIENYKDVLLWTKEALFKQNTNKIKTIGNAFGELLPNLLF